MDEEIPFPHYFLSRRKIDFLDGPTRPAEEMDEEISLLRKLLGKP